MIEPPRQSVHGSGEAERALVRLITPDPLQVGLLGWCLAGPRCHGGWCTAPGWLSQRHRHARLAASTKSNSVSVSRCLRVAGAGTGAATASEQATRQVTDNWYRRFGWRRRASR